MAEESTLFEWLVDGAPGATTWKEILDRTAEGILAAGVPVDRFALFEPTLHPTVLARAYFWAPPEPSHVEMLEALSGTLGDASSTVLRSGFQASPLYRIIREKTPVRYELHRVPPSPDEDEIFAELRPRGMTDYFGVPVIFRGGGADSLSVSTRRPEGFRAEDLAVIQRIVRPLARVLEATAMRHTAEGLLATYLGHRVGTRVLEGRVRRGDLDLLRAVIWFSDLRGFTAASAVKPPQAVIEMVNDLFECQVPAIVRHGGEVLKFIGDGLLAIFPCADAASTGDVCVQAMAAADEAFAALGVKNDGQQDPLRMGLALHLGEVAYGNVGGSTRLDFTAIGPAVNLAARLEGLTATVGHRVLVSSDFARHAGRAVTSTGTFELKGIPTAQEVFVPAGHEGSY